jgi:RNA polymerase sigma-70 factor, ECF subfamily
MVGQLLGRHTPSHPLLARLSPRAPEEPGTPWRVPGSKVVTERSITRCVDMDNVLRRDGIVTYVQRCRLEKRTYHEAMAWPFIRPSPERLAWVSTEGAIGAHRPRLEDLLEALRSVRPQVNAMLQRDRPEKYRAAGIPQEEATGDAGNQAPQFEDIFHDRGGDVYRFCLSQLRNPALAEEMASEVFFRAFKAYERVKPTETGVIPWLFRIAQNAIIDHHRRAHRWTRVFDRLTHENHRVDDAEYTAGVRADLRLLIDMMAELSERDRMLVGLRVGADLSYSAIAEIMDMKQHAVIVATNRALSRLRQRCTEEL